MGSSWQDLHEAVDGLIGDYEAAKAENEQLRALLRQVRDLIAAGDPYEIGGLNAEALEALALIDKSGLLGGSDG